MKIGSLRYSVVWRRYAVKDVFLPLLVSHQFEFLLLGPGVWPCVPFGSPSAASCSLREQLTADEAPKGTGGLWQKEFSIAESASTLNRWK